MHALTQEELAAGSNGVMVAGKGVGKVVQVIPSGSDQVASLKVLFPNGISCVYANDAAILKAAGRVTVAVTPWRQAPVSGEWLSLYVGPGGLAGRVYDVGVWNVYNGKGEWQEGRASSVPEAKKQAAAVLRSYGADVTVLVAE